MAWIVPPGQDTFVVPEHDVAVGELAGGRVKSGETDAAAGRYCEDDLNTGPALVPQLHFEGKVIENARAGLSKALSGGCPAAVIDRGASESGLSC